MKKKKMGFQLPNWGAQSSFNYGPAPMNIPAFDVGSGSLGSFDFNFDIADMSDEGSGSLGSYNFDIADMSGAGAGAGGYQPLELGMNIPTFQLGLNGLGALGKLWGTYQSNKLARDSFNFQKGMAEKNYTNQIKSYNTALTDRATTRGFVQGDSTEKTQQYISGNKL